MDLILTHDFADFDALAALVAARKLMPSDYAVQPRRVNRNVRRFLNLYLDELPLTQFDDLPKERVESVLLVDVQHLQAVRGMDDATSVRVVDHHPSQGDEPPEWEVTIEPVGATTTLLCERLQTSGERLARIEASLFLLGIYEDTGSLSFATTTPRDARAAAWLLEQGASLDVLREFLHHPLAEEQHALYELLVDNAETHQVEGYSVVLAWAEAHDAVEEVSPLAHALSDLFNPAALVMLVDLGSHIQLVARSSVDALDVGRLAQGFGGGGHARAAAAILRDTDLSKARAAVLDALPGAVQDGVSVAHLMSRGVLTFPPDTRADEAAESIRRYGYEGYPVLDGDRLVGLLTRRAVDRALGHGLTGVRVVELMNAGAFTVSPVDSVARVQEVMMSSGWGQIPVVDDEGSIIGVVTRTDLIRQWAVTSEARGPARPSQAEVLRLLDEALPPPLMALVRHAGQVAGEMDASLYLVGGIVRDLLLGQPNIDVDFVVEGDAIALVERLGAQFGGETRSHARFGTGKWLLEADVWARLCEQAGLPSPDTLWRNGDLPESVDFVTARTEFYAHPSALPEVERGSIKLDLHRRDFTANTLAIQLDPARLGRLLDFWDGLRDLERRVIRVLHSLSFVDDPTRILRAVRLEQRLGFRIEPRTEELIQAALPMLGRVSGDRIRHELESIFAEERPEDALVRLARLGVLATLHPALAADGWLRCAYAALRSAAARPLWPELADLPNLEVPYFALLARRLSAKDSRAVSKRLKVQRRSAEDLRAASRLLRRMPFLEVERGASELDAALSEYGDRALLVGWAAATSATARAQVERYALKLRHVQPSVDGQALIEMGLTPGPEFGAILSALRAAWLDGEVRDVEGERALLAELLQPDPQE